MSMRRAMRSGLAAVLLAGTLVLVVGVQPAAARAVPWVGADIATTADFATSVAFGDLDGDGDLDLLSSSQNDDTIAWYENTAGDGSAWTPTDIATTADWAQAVAVGDLDGDGDLDLASASGNDDTIAWYENTAGDGSAWTAVDIATTAAEARAVAVGDLDGDGDLDLVSASATDDTIAWYENTAGDGSAWTAADIATTADGALSVAVGDLDGDGDVDLASASMNDDTIAWYENTAGNGSAWTATDITTTADFATSVAVGDLDGDGDLDLASTSLSDDTVAWYENTAGDGSAWTAADIATSAAAPMSVAVGDLDSDGDLDLASASGNDDTVAWYENTAGNGSAWTATDIATTAGSAAWVAVGDLDGDGDLDLASASRSDDTIARYRNDTIHRRATAWSAADIDTAAANTSSVAFGDLDGDGDLDLASTSFADDTITWYENTAGDGSAWAATDITTTADGARSVAVGDLDGDGDLDLASAEGISSTIAWYENTAGDGSAWTAADIDTAAPDAWTVAVGDLDGDGDLDLASASTLDDTIAWYENTAGDGSAWAATDVATTADGAHGVAVGDLDGDGDLDLASASVTDDTIAWYENTAGDGSAWAATDIATTAAGGNSVAVGDLDGDGDLDLASASVTDDTIAWYENTAGDGSGWAATDVATTAVNARSVAVGDLDGDGDLDLASASEGDSTIAWYENTAGDGSAWAATDVATTADQARSVAVGDLDGDGDLDLASASRLDNTIARYRNDGGQVAMSTTATGPASVTANTADDVLRITVAHQGRAGDHSAELTGVALRLDDGATALTQVQAEAIIDELRLYRDDGDSTFDADDTLVTAASSLAVNGSGDLTLPIPDVTSAAFSAAASATFFVVVDLAADAHLQAPNTLRVTHRAASSTAEDDAFTVALTKAPATSSSATTLTATNSAPVADAGGPYTAASGTSIVLDGSGSTDTQQASSALGYAWDLDGDGAYDDSTSRTPTFNATGSAGNHTVGLRVTDDGALTGTDTATVNVTVATFGPAPTTTTTTGPTTSTTFPSPPPAEIPPPAVGGGGSPMVFVDGRPTPVPVPPGAAGRPIAGSIGVSPTESIVVTPDGRVIASPGLNFGGLTRPPAKPIVGMAAHWVLRGGAWRPDGYWLVGADGGVFSFGGARFHGSLGNRRLAAPVVAITGTNSGRGYWLVGRDGGVFAFGDARYHGSTGGRRLAAPIIGLAPTTSGKGYWLGGADGGIFTFGDARFLGSGAARRTLFTGLAAAPDGTYWLIGREGDPVQFTGLSRPSRRGTNRAISRRSWPMTGGRGA
jgi:hypothetical protein